MEGARHIDKLSSSQDLLTDLRMAPAAPFVCRLIRDGLESSMQTFGEFLFGVY